MDPDRPPPAPPKPAPRSGAPARDDRLKAELRANLQRRKAQARARAAGEDAQDTTDD